MDGNSISLWQPLTRHRTHFCQLHLQELWNVLNHGSDGHYHVHLAHSHFSDLQTFGPTPICYQKEEQ